jgi:hypothetical protein
VRGGLRESEPVERAPHPDPLHSPSKTGVNALMASGEREKKRCPAQFVPARPVYVLANPLRVLVTVKVPSVCAETLIQ